MLPDDDGPVWFSGYGATLLILLVLVEAACIAYRIL
jgi:hypothetical protein